MAEATNLYHLPVGAKAPDQINCVVEIPFGSRNKYEYDHELGIFTLDRVLHSAVYYPGDYGFVPQTLALDGDPLDVIVLVTEATFPGCLVSVRPIGVLKMIDAGDPDDKILAVPVGEPDYADVTEYDQIFAHQLRKIANFFETYKKLEGKTTEVGGWEDAASAKRIVLESAARFAEKH